MQDVKESDSSSVVSGCINSEVQSRVGAVPVNAPSASLYYNSIRPFLPLSNPSGTVGPAAAKLLIGTIGYQSAVNIPVPPTTPEQISYGQREINSGLLGDMPALGKQPIGVNQLPPIMVNQLVGYREPVSASVLNRLKASGELEQVNRINSGGSNFRNRS